MRVLVYGANGWIGSQLCDLISEAFPTAEIARASARLENLEKVRVEIEEFVSGGGDLRVICAAGLTGSHAPPYNVDWCETNQERVLEVNVSGVVHLAKCCAARNVHLTYMGTGCIYEYDEAHAIGGRGFTETEEPNFIKSFYSLTKIVCERMLQPYMEHTLVLRVRMPISAHHHPRNFVTKISQYERVVDVPNSMTLLPSLLPVAVDMMRLERVGVYNFCNPGTLSHNEILELYREHVDAAFTWQNFSLAEQARILRAGRSNNTLDCSKLLRLYPDIPSARECLVELFRNGF